MILIGITGKARSGKDTTADILSKRFGLIKYSFATPIKEAAKVMFGLTEEHVNGEFKEDIIPWIGVSPRRIMQTLGTDWGRDIIRGDIWVQVAKRRFEGLSEYLDNTFHCGMVIPDVRFENEADFIRENGGAIIHVSRTNIQGVEQHRSESGIEFKKGDARVVNDGSLEDLENTIESVILNDIRI